MKLQKCFNFTGEEDFFKGHFPEQAILPGVIQLEIAHHLAEEMVGKTLVLKAAKKVKFMEVIMPREKFEVEVEGLNVEKIVGEGGEVNYCFSKGDKVCSQGTLVY